ncbi:MAG: hypothetical protein UY82_C0061G0009 [Candidatus Uhrbacteria bacterium GW2011_GWC2_53_7]|uniref:Uncharacterized protein n=1 Tax=Candidatus Uhrbacteria bacterium GW2011_GWC2_53_7 TaxID=1618986 RepID=A0A0G1XUT0_9BACT|nr:MAG: hypothetical protein UY82_C0061G0009 [Candidatus Uhrbacteria bacterium GW2011_GWC2_53_7]
MVFHTFVLGEPILPAEDLGLLVPDGEVDATVESFVAEADEGCVVVRAIGARPEVQGRIAGDHRRPVSHRVADAAGAEDDQETTVSHRLRLVPVVHLVLEEAIRVPLLDALDGALDDRAYELHGDGLAWAGGLLDLLDGGFDQIGLLLGGDLDDLAGRGEDDVLRLDLIRLVGGGAGGEGDGEGGQEEGKGQGAQPIGIRHGVAGDLRERNRLGAGKPLLDLCDPVFPLTKLSQKINQLLS